MKWFGSAQNPRHDAEVAIHLDKVAKRYGDFEAVKGISFDVKAGEIFGMLGPNGAGKSTLIRMMTTLIPITTGHAYINGHDVTLDPDAVRHGIGVIPQAMTSDQELTVEENLSTYAKLYGVPKHLRQRNIQDLLEAVGLVEWRKAETGTLSGGMRRRLEIARGLMHNPKILFLDEPTTGLDPLSRIAVWDLLNHFKKNKQLTILITTHYMDEADKLCDRIAIVDKGQLVALDTPLHLKQTVEGANVVEVQFQEPPSTWTASLQSLPNVNRVQQETGQVFRLFTTSTSRTTTSLVALAAQHNVPITALNVQNTTLDDVFIHYTGHQLRDKEE